MAVNLKAKPFYLDDEAVAWVRETIGAMTVEEKIGQLFINLGKSSEESYIREMVDNYHIGGARYTESDRYKVWQQNQWYQTHSKQPMLIAANCETGGRDVCREGTFVATQAQCGADDTAAAAYELGRISGIEAAAVGVNWTFGPAVDILYNWRNTIVNSRSFGNTADLVIERAKAYMTGVRESRMVTCAKHFPGDGVEERDQHLVMGINDQSCEEWDQSFGRVYEALIEADVESIMVGHIALPAYSKRFCPDICAEDILPATLAPEIITGLLREQLGFNGVVVTDASHMGGLYGAAPRSQQVVGAIVAGCDMFLFFNDPQEDFEYMLEGYRSGVIAEQRLQEALERIMGLKAKLGLHKGRTLPAIKRLQEIESLQHLKVVKEIADRTITLVKDTQKLLPLDVHTQRRARLYFLESAPVSYVDGTDPAKQIVVEELERVGFEVDVHKSYYEMELQAPHFSNRLRAMVTGKVEDFKDAYDVVFVFVHIKGYAQMNNMRLCYSAPHSNELPWWIREVATVCVSLNYTNHLYDLPMMRTYINAYAPTRECIRSTVEKIVGKHPFEGNYNENVWCGCWETRL